MSTAGPPNATQALLAALSAFETAEDRVALLPELERLARAADARDEVAEALENASESVEAAPVLCALLRLAARLREELGEPAKAVMLWNDLLAAQPVDVEALDALARLFTQANDFVRAAEVAVRRARLLHPGPERHGRFVAAADLLLRAGNREAALEALEESLSRPAVAEVVSAVGAVHVRRGALLETRRPADAVASYAVALAVPELASAAVAGLGRLLAVPAARAAAAAALEPAVRQRGEPTRLAEVLEARAETVAEPAVWLELARLREQGGEPRLAFAALGRAFALAPADAAVRDELERLAARLDARDELLAAYEEVLHRDPNRADPALLRRVAELHDALGNREPALEAWEWATEVAPGDAALLAAYAERCRRKGDLALLAKVLRRQLAAGPDQPTRVKLLGELGRLCEDLSDFVGASHAYQDLFDAAPGDRRLLKTLERLYEQTGNAAALAGTLERALLLAKDAPTAERVALALRLARLKLAPPEDDARALELLREVLTLAPGNAQAVAALAQLASTPGPVQATASELVAPALDALGDYPAVVQLLEAQLATQTSARERVATLRRIADLYAGPMEDADLAFLAITRALREAPHDAGLLARALELADAADATEELDLLLGELAGAQPPGDARLGLFRTLAQRHDARAAQDPDARDEGIAAWSEVLVQAPHDAQALDRLEALFAQSGRLADLAVLWRQRADAAPANERSAQLLRLAGVHERAGDLDAAAATLLNLFAVTRAADTLVPLERVLGKAGRHLERAEALLRLGELARKAGNEKEYVDRLVQRARALTAAGEPERAVPVYAEALQHTADEPRAVTDLVALVADARVREPAAELLASVFTAPEQRSQRAAVLEVLAGTPGLAREAAFRGELAALHERLGDATQAFAGWLRLVREHPDDAAARTELERLARSGHFEEELVATYEELLEQRPKVPRELRRHLQATAARLYAGPLGAPDAALRTWEDLARSDRDALEAVQALEPLYRERGDWVRLAEVLERQAQLLSGDERVASLRRLAELAEGPLKDPAVAVDALGRLLEVAPTDAAALRALARLHESAGRPAQAAQLLERLLALLDAATARDEVVALSLEAARLEAGRPARAVEHLARALKLGADETATRGLEALLEADLPVRARAAEALESVYRARGDTPRLATMLELQVPVASAERQVALLEETAALCEALGELPRAFDARREWYARRPGAGAAAELQRLAEATGRLGELVESLAARLAQGPAADEALELWRRVAVAKQSQGDREGAAKAWAQVAARAPGELAPLEALTELYEVGHQYAELPRVLTARARLETEVPRQVQLLLRAAEVAEWHLEDLSAAIDAATAVRARKDARALPLLERLYERSGRVDELRSLLLEQLEAARGGEALSLRVRLARVEHRYRNDDAAALELLAKVRREEPGHAEAVAALEEVMRSQRPAAARAAEALESHYQRAGLAALQAEALEVRAAAAAAEERAALLHRVADLHEGAWSSPAAAFEVVARLLREQPGDARALERVQALGGAARLNDRLAELLDEVAPKAPEAARPAVLRALVAVRQRLGDAPRALDAVLALLALAPDDVPALEQASALLQGAARWSELERVLQRRYELAGGDDERLATLVKLGDLYEGALDRPSAALEAWRRVLELRPEDETALRRLDALCVLLERWDELAEVLGRRLHVGAGDRTTLLLRLANVRREKLENAAAALPLLGELLSDDPHHPGARLELEGLVQAQPGWEPAADLLLGTYRRTHDVEKLARWLEACAREALPGPKRRALWVELADLQVEHLGNAERAFRAMTQAFHEAPTDAGVREQLAKLAESSGEWAALASAYEQELPRLVQPHAAEVALSLAQVCEAHLGQPERAVDLYRAAQREPRAVGRALAGLDRTLTQLSAWQELLPVLEAREQAAEEGPERVALLLRIARVSGEHLGVEGRAAEAYRAVLVREPAHLGAARALEALYERTGQTARLIDILERLLELETGAALRAARLKLARLYGADEPERCIALCRALLQDDPLHPDAFALLTGRLEVANRWDELEKLLQATLLVTLVPEDAAALAFRLADLTRDQLGRPRDAVARYRAVLDRSPGHVPALEALRELHEAANELPALSEVLGELAAVHPEPARRRAHHVRRAEVLLALGEREAAVDSARQALALEKGDAAELEPLWRRLRPVVLQAEALPEAATVLERLAKLSAEGGRPSDAVTTLLELASVEVRRANTTGACAALERALRHDPKQRAAYEQLDALYTQSAAWAPWASLAERFLGNLAGAERLGVLERLASVYATQLGDQRTAFRWALEAVRMDPGSAPRRQVAEQLGVALRSLPVLVQTYAETLAGLSFGPAYESLALALAAVQDGPLNQLEAAEKTLREVLARAPGHAGALDALVAMYERRGLHERHVGALEQKLETTSDRAVRKRLLQAIATLRERALAQPAQAAHALRRLLELEPSVPHARLLVALHQRQQAWPYVLEALLEVRDLSPRDERAAVQLEIASLHEKELEDPEAAVAAYQDALGLDAKSSDAFRGLERLFLALERKGELLHAYEQRLAQPIADEEKVELHSKLAALWEERGQPLNADAALVSVLKLDASHLPALEDLARLRRATSRWRPLAETLARLALVVTEPSKLAALCTEAGQVHLERLREPPAAERWWSQALAHVPEYRPALEALVELMLSQFRWQDGLDFLARVVRLESEPAARAALEFRAGTVHEERLKDPQGARAAYRRALQAEPVHVPSLRRLRALFLQAGEWKEYEANLALEATRGPGPVERCAAAVELAAHFDQRNQKADAARWYEHALVARPEALEAALPLGDLLVAGQQWPRAVEVLTHAVALLEREGVQRQVDRVHRLCQLAQAHRQLAQPRQALEAYTRALVLDPVHATALRGQVDVLVALGQLDEATRKLRLYDERHGPNLPRGQRAGTRLERAQLHWRLNDARETQVLAEGALELEPQQVDALRLLIAACDAQSAFDKAATARQRLAALLQGDERHRLLLEFGQLLRDKLSSPTRALDAFLEALKAKSGSRPALRELFVTYREVGHNRKSAEYLERLVLHPEAPEDERRNDTLVLADLVGRQIGDVDRAADVLTRALEDTPDFVEALQALEVLLTRTRGWRRLATAYELLIRRLGEGASSAGERASLWQRLGELKLKRLEDAAGALRAFEGAAALLPTDVAAQEAFADLALASFPERTSDAVRACLRALPQGGSAAKLCAAVAAQAEREKDADTGWLAARAAEVVGAVNERHRAALERLAPSAAIPPVFRAPLSDQGWRQRLLHPMARGPIGEVMAVLAEPWTKKHSTGLSAHDVHPKKHLVDQRTVTHPALVDLLHVARALGFESIDLYSPYLAPQTSSRRQAHPLDPVGVQVLPTFPPAVVVGEALVSARDRVALHATCGQSLAALRPELALPLQLSREAMELLFEAALSAGDPAYVSRVDAQVLKVERKRVEKALSSQGREALGAAVKRYLRAAKPGDFPRFLEGAARTPLRVALLVSGDLATVRQRLVAPGAPADATLRDLLDFALGGELHALRVEVGCALAAR